MKKNPHAQALGRLGGLARAKTLTAERQAAILVKARASKAARRLVRQHLKFFP